MQIIRETEGTRRTIYMHTHSTPNPKRDCTDSIESQRVRRRTCTGRNQLNKLNTKTYLLVHALLHAVTRKT